MVEESLKKKIEAYGERALEASGRAKLLDSSKKNDILLGMAKQLEAKKRQIQEANLEDVSQAKQAGLSPALCDRLLLNDLRFSSMTEGLRNLAQLADPLGEIIEESIRPNGLQISKVRVPIGVIAIIYESRPNVTADAAGICVRSSNAVILRGGSEAFKTNKAIAEALISGGTAVGMPEGLVQFVDVKEREAVSELVSLEGKVHLVIPRGGEGLIRTVCKLSRVPVLKHYKGVCHIYVDSGASLEMASRIVENAKCQRPGVCNALETLLVHNDCAERFLLELAPRLLAKGVELRGDKQVCSLVPQAREASTEDWDTEYLSLVLSIKVVPGIEQAISHINEHGSEHTDGIVSDDQRAQSQFVQGVNSGVVMINASTRFNDGGEFGMGAEMGISTDRLHARGPVGPRELTTYQYIVRGQGQVRE